MEYPDRLVLDVALVFIGWALGRARRAGLAKMPKPVIYDLYGLKQERWDWVPIFGYRRVRERAHWVARRPWNRDGAAAGFGAMGKN